MSEKTVGFGEWFWDDDFWLPPNITWKDVTNKPDGSGIRYADFNHLAYPLVLCWALVAVRLAVENLFFRPLGKWLGIKHHKPNRSKLSPNPELEMEFRRSQKWSHETIAKFSRKLNVTQRDVQIWLRYQRILSRPSKLDKFSETGWRFAFYASIFGYGFYVLSSKMWFYDIVDCWVNYPHHEMLNDVWWYYMIELSFYWCLFFSQFLGDVVRKDFWSMFFHHVATIMLISFSWCCHLHRVGTLVMISCDVADIFLESAKLFHYSGVEPVANVLFALFVLVWVISRLGVFPTWILYSITVEAPQLIQYFPAYFFFNLLLSSLLVLFIVWTYFIIKVAYINLLSPADSLKDIRSQSEDEQSEIDTKKIE